VVQPVIHDFRVPLSSVFLKAESFHASFPQRLAFNPPEMDHGIREAIPIPDDFLYPYKSSRIRSPRYVSISAATLESVSFLLTARLKLDDKKGLTMKNSTRDQSEGKVHEVKGGIKEKVGRMTKNPNLEAEGKDEKVGGKVQKKIGQIEKVFDQ
jgi:uncharacterized protein YjbJ (UPF0337 family)